MLRQTMVHALAKAGIDVMSDCERGECGLCAIDVVACAAEIDHRDAFFNDEQRRANDIASEAKQSRADAPTPQNLPLDCFVALFEVGYSRLRLMLLAMTALCCHAANEAISARKCAFSSSTRRRSSSTLRW
jgi:ferredoxin